MESQAADRRDCEELRLHQLGSADATRAAKARRARAHAPRLTASELAEKLEHIDARKWLYAIGDGGVAQTEPSDARYFVKIQEIRATLEEMLTPGPSFLAAIRWLLF